MSERIAVHDVLRRVSARCRTHRIWLRRTRVKLRCTFRRGVRIVGMPLDEFLFAAAFGAYWSGIYEHFTWKGLSKQ